MKLRSSWVIVPAVIILALSVICGYLVNQNAICTKNNRELLLQNDSVLSANLNLKYELEKLKTIRANNTNELNYDRSVKK